MEIPKTQQQLHKEEQVDNSVESHQPAKLQPRHAESDRIRINADDQTKCKLFCYAFIIILFIIVVSLVAFLALPQATLTLTPYQELFGTNISQCVDPLALVSGSLTCNSTKTGNSLIAGEYVYNLAELNQFLIFYLLVKDSSLYNLNEQVHFTLYHTSRRQVNQSVIIQTDSVSTQFTSTLNDGSKDASVQGRYYISFVTKLTQSDEFYWQLNFSNTSVFKSTNQFKLQSVVVNRKFTLFTIIIRAVFFVISVVVLILFNRLILKLPKDLVSVEQRFIQLLSVITLTFNDQFYFISVIYPNPASSFVSSFFIWNFVFLLFLIWAFFLSRINSEQNEVAFTNLITKTKVAIVVIFYILLLAYNVAYAIVQTSDHPVFSSDSLSSAPVLGLKGVAYVAFALAVVYIIYLYISIFSRRPHRMWRSSIFIYISLLFFIATTIFFFAGGYNIFDYSAPKIMFYIVFMNVYSYLLQYLYAPTREQMQRWQRGEFHKSDRSVVGNEQLLDIPEDAVDVNVELLEEQSQKSNENNSDNQEEGSAKRSSIRKHKKGLRKQRNLNSSKDMKDEEKPYDQFENKSDGFQQM